MAQSTKHYLYLLKRDKKGMILLTIQQGNPIQRTELFDLKLVQATPQIMTKLKSTYQEHFMDYELWIESAPSFQSILDRLRSQGYSKLPNSATPLAGWMTVPSSAPLPKPRQSMVQRKF